MTTRAMMLTHLKQQGASTIQDLIQALGISENAVRHHLKNLEQEGFIQVSLSREGVGRPAKRYELTLAAEGQFPKRYHELLDIVLEQAERSGSLQTLMNKVAASLSESLRSNLMALEPKARLLALMQHLDYGDMLGQFKDTEGGWEFKAYNCVYRDTGCKFEPVCNLLPTVIQLSTQLPAERVICQRDGLPYCHFAGGYQS